MRQNSYWYRWLRQLSGRGVGSIRKITTRYGACWCTSRRSLETSSFWCSYITLHGRSTKLQR